MAERNLQPKAELLAALTTHQVGVLQLASETHVGPARLIRLLKEMQEEGLIETGEVRVKRVGRPKRTARVTPLGAEFLNKFRELKMKMLKSHKFDLQRAAVDGGHARRLAARGVSTTDLFLELNTLARRTSISTR